MRKIICAVLLLLSVVNAQDVFSQIDRCQEIKKPKLYNFNTLNDKGETPLTELTRVNCQNGIKIAKSIIDNSNTINKQNKEGDTPLLLAIKRDKPYLARLFIKEGADLNIASSKDGKTPLVLATIKQDKDLVRILIERYAKTDLKDKSGYRALDYAIKNGLYEIAQIIYGTKKGNFIFFQNSGDKPIFLKLTRNGFKIKDKNIDKKKILFAYVDKNSLKKICKTTKNENLIVLAMMSYKSKPNEMNAASCKNIKLLRFNKKFYILLMRALRWRTPPLFLLRDDTGHIIASGIDMKFLEKNR